MISQISPYALSLSVQDRGALEAKVIDMPIARTLFVSKEIAISNHCFLECELMQGGRE